MPMKDEGVWRAHKNGELLAEERQAVDLVVKLRELGVRGAKTTFVPARRLSSRGDLASPLIEDWAEA